MNEALLAFLWFVALPLICRSAAGCKNGVWLGNGIGGGDLSNGAAREVGGEQPVAPVHSEGGSIPSVPTGADSTEVAAEMDAQDGSSLPADALSADAVSPIRDELGQILRGAYRQTVDEAIPDDLMDLLNRLE